MFLKYLLNNVRKNVPKYITIVVCEVVLLLITLFAGAVIMNYVSEEEGAQFHAKRFAFSFLDLDGINLSDPANAEYISEAMSRLPKTQQLRDRIYEFCEKSPVSIDYLTIDLCSGKNSYWPRLLYFSTYEDLVEFYTETHKKYWSLPKSALPTREQYQNREKVVILGTGPGSSDKGEYCFSDENHVLFGNNDDEYLVVGKNPALMYFDFFLGSEPDNIKISSVDFMVSDFISEEQRAETERLFKEIVTPDVSVKNAWLPNVKDLLEVRKSSSLLALTALMLLISSFNIMAIFRNIIDERKSSYAIFRLCGYSKLRSMLFPFFEAIGLAALGAVLSCILFAIFSPLLAIKYPVIPVLFGAELYAAFSAGFVVVSAVLFVIYILPSLNKSVSGELREM